MHSVHLVSASDPFARHRVHIRASTGIQGSWMGRRDTSNGFGFCIVPALGCCSLPPFLTYPRWYREQLPVTMLSRSPPHLTRNEMVKLVG